MPDYLVTAFATLLHLAPDGSVVLPDGADRLGAAADGRFVRCRAGHPAASLYPIDAALLADLSLLLGQRWVEPARGVIASWQAVQAEGGIRLRG
jgi:hypothetical protein